MPATVKVYTSDDMDVVNLALAPGIDLPPFEVTKYMLPKDGEDFMVLEIDIPSSWKPDSCPYCGSKKIVSDGRSEQRVIRDISRNNCCVSLVMSPRRYKCGDKNCMKRIPIEFPGFKRSATVTDRVIDYINREAFFQSFQVLSERTGLTSATVRNYFKARIIELEEDRKNNPIEAPAVLGLDEKWNAHKAMGVIVDITNKRLLDMTPTNQKEELIGAIKKLKNWDKNIKIVTTDMSCNYHSWLPKLLPNATLVVDKFHVIQDMNKAINAARPALYQYCKAKAKKIPDLKERENKLAVLRFLADDVYLLNHSGESLEEDKEKKKQVAALCIAFPEIAMFRKMSAPLEKMYTMTNRADAEKCWDEWQDVLPPPRSGRGQQKKFEDWCKTNDVPPTAFMAFRKFRSDQGVLKYKDAILNYFLPGCKYTNAATEGFNNAIGTINKRGNGYSFEILRALAIYAPTVHSRYKYTFKLTTKKKWASAKNPTKFVSYSGLAEELGSIIQVTVPVCEFQTIEIPIDDLMANITSENARYALYEMEEYKPVPNVKISKVNSELSIRVKR